MPRRAASRRAIRYSAQSGASGSKFRLLLHLCAFGLLFGTAPCGALAQVDQPIGCATTEGPAGTVVKIESSLVLRLDSGLSVRLSEIGAPGADWTDRPSTDVTAAALHRLALGKTAQIFFDGAKTDRHGRALGQVVVGGEGGGWLQRALLEEGAAYVDTWPTNRACAAGLLAAEATARGAAKGMWSDPDNRILSVAEAAEAEGRFAIIEGQVLDVSKAGKPQRWFLNFGADWRKDFTVTIEPGALRLFKKAGVDPATLKGAQVRVRGYVGWSFGPEIAAANPEVIEVLTAGPAAAGNPQ